MPLQKSLIAGKVDHALFELDTVEVPSDQVLQ